MGADHPALIEEQVDELAALLTARGWRLATAESCTGGWLAKVLTDRAGSSGWFDRGLVTYSNESKTALLGVNPDSLRRHGAVSAETATAMVEGLLATTQAQLAVAITGIAGPDGGSADKPVGTVYLAWALRDQDLRWQRCQFAGTRDQVRQQSVTQALEFLLGLAHGC